MEYDARWLLGIQRRRRAGEAWEGEMQVFLRSQRQKALRAVARHQRRLGFDPAAVEDQAEDVVANADEDFMLRGVEAFRGDCPPGAYYLRIVRNAAVSEYRAKRMTAEIPVAWLVRDPGGPDWFAAIRDERDEARRLTLRHDLLWALEQLREQAPDQADAVALFFLGGIGSADEGAARVGTTREGFHQRVHRGIRKLAKILTEAGYESPASPDRRAPQRPPRSAQGEPQCRV